jgi:hypothetical protein
MKSGAVWLQTTQVGAWEVSPPSGYPCASLLLARLHGRHQLVLGDHDRTATAMLAIGFQT